MGDEEVRSLRVENAELRRLLSKHQWSGLTPIKSTGACPECSGSKPLTAVVIDPAARWPPPWQQSQTDF